MNVKKEMKNNKNERIDMGADEWTEDK